MWLLPVPELVRPVRQASPELVRLCLWPPFHPQSQCSIALCPHQGLPEESLKKFFLILAVCQNHLGSSPKIQTPGPHRRPFESESLGSSQVSVIPTLTGNLMGLEPQSGGGQCGQHTGGQGQGLHLSALPGQWVRTLPPRGDVGTKMSSFRGKAWHMLKHVMHV